MFSGYSAVWGKNKKSIFIQTLTLSDFTTGTVLKQVLCILHQSVALSEVALMIILKSSAEYTGDHTIKSCFLVPTFISVNFMQVSLKENAVYLLLTL